MQKNNHYTVLEINASADFSEIKVAYRRLVKKYHPDKNPGNIDSEEYFKQIQHAYYVLSDVHRRKQYDLGKGLYRPNEQKNKYSSVYKAQKEPFQEQEIDIPSLFSQYKGEFKLLIISIIISLIFLYFIVTY